MKCKGSRLVPLTVLALILTSVAPLAFASTLTVNLNTKAKIAVVTSVSTTKIVLAYPAGSSMSGYLKEYNSSIALKGSFKGGSDGVNQLQTHFDDEDNRASIQNMTVAFNYSAKGNATALVVNKETDITAWVSGVFNVTNGKVTADLGWRSFSVPGEMNLNLEEHHVDVNLVGSAMTESLGARVSVLGILTGMFGGAYVWQRPTINFSSLNSPLSTWTRNYNSLTNTTTFSKTVSGQSTFTASVSNNGQRYSISAVSDPSAAISTQGYAVASGNSLTIQSTPILLSPVVWASVAVGIGVLGGIAYALIRSRRSTRQKSFTLPASPA
ncbi:MAG: hypothetical protein OK422_06580 [Thaumarchaeota archaeon]|nr:hypothetical protein [Nitrososphaerota archaeon]